MSSRILVGRKHFGQSLKRSYSIHSDGEDDDENETDTSNGPLQTCLDWVRTVGATQYVLEDDDDETTLMRYDVDFIVVAHEVLGSTKKSMEYEAFSGDELARWARTPSFQRHAHEVIWTPTKLYAELDMYCIDTFDAPALAAEFTRALETAVRDRFPAVARTATLVLDASRPGEKVSRHVVIDMYDATERPVRFTSSEHCRAFVAEVEHKYAFHERNRAKNGDATTVADYGVYSRTGKTANLRMYGSTKTEFGNSFPLLPLGSTSDSVTRRGVLSVSTLERSLVTWPRVTEPGQLLVMDTVTLARTLVMPGSRHTRTRAHAELTGGEMDRLRHVLAATLPCASITRIARAPDKDHVFYVSTNERYCPCKGDTHHSSRQKFLVNARTMQYTQRCWSPKCRTQPYTWHALDDAAVAALTPLVRAPPIVRELTRSAPPQLETSAGRTMHLLFRMTQPPTR